MKSQMNQSAMDKTLGITSTLENFEDLLTPALDSVSDSNLAEKIESVELKDKEPKSISPTQSENDMVSDYDIARSNIYETANEINKAIHQSKKLFKIAPSARALEVMFQGIKMKASVTKEILELHKMYRTVGKLEKPAEKVMPIKEVNEEKSEELSFEDVIDGIDNKKKETN